MIKALGELIKQPYWIVALLIGAVFIALSCVKVEEGYRWSTHSPDTYWLATIGLVLLLLSALAFTLNVLPTLRKSDVGAGVDLDRVKEDKHGELSTTVNGCEIRVVAGRIEDFAHARGTVVVLPCNEYFDDRCVDDPKSALGAFVNRAFDGQTHAFIKLMTDECGRKFGSAEMRQKTTGERAESFGTGKCILLEKPLGRSVPVALVSTTTQRAGEGLAARISYLFDGMRALVTCLPDARIDEIVMPLLGSGNGGLDRPLAFVGLLLALAEVARYGQGSQRPKRVTVVLFKRDADSQPEVDSTVVRRALALIGSRD